MSVEMTIYVKAQVADESNTIFIMYAATFRLTLLKIDIVCYNEIEIHS